jgi:hypothetical protein
MKLLLPALLLCGAIATPTYAWQNPFGSLSSNEWHKSAGEFEATMVITDKYQDFLEAWQKPASPNYRPNISTTETAVRGQTVRVILLLVNCTQNESGNCNTRVDFKITKPDGSVYDTYKDNELWQGKQPPKDLIILSNSSLGFNVEQDDPYGVYQISATIRDENSGKNFELLRRLTVKAEQSSGHTP